jgi:hypothetical protein
MLSEDENSNDSQDWRVIFLLKHKHRFPVLLGLEAVFVVPSLVC